VVPGTVTLSVLSWNPGADNSRLYVPDGPPTVHTVADPLTLHGPEPVIAPDSVSVRPDTGPPAADVMFTVIASGNAQAADGTATQSGWVCCPQAAARHAKISHRSHRSGMATDHTDQE
jgi:hypothetical protein